MCHLCLDAVEEGSENLSDLHEGAGSETGVELLELFDEVLSSILNGGFVLAGNLLGALLEITEPVLSSLNERFAKVTFAKVNETVVVLHFHAFEDTTDVFT